MATQDKIRRDYLTPFNDEMDRLLALRDGGAVKRFHTWRTVGNQLVGTHSYGTVQIILFLDPEASRELILAGMFHDNAEFYAGDMPAPAKRLSRALYEELKNVEEYVDEYLGIKFNLSGEERLVLQLADTLECALYSYEERMLGNQNMDKVFENCMLFIKDTVSGYEQPRPAHITRARELAVHSCFLYNVKAGGNAKHVADII